MESSRERAGGGVDRCLVRERDGLIPPFGALFTSALPSRAAGAVFVPKAWYLEASVMGKRPLGHGLKLGGEGFAFCIESPELLPLLGHRISRYSNQYETNRILDSSISSIP